MTAAMTGAACRQPGCTGTLQDGYCNVCGMAPGPATGASAPPTPSQPAPASPMTATPGRSATAGGSTRLTSGRTTGTRRTTTSRSTASTRSRIGAGLVQVPPMAVPDPASVILTHPTVAEDKRFCAHCGEPVGRSHDGQAGRPEGFCGNCRWRFSFTPKLQTGEVVGGQYEVAGCLAHGGLGWIYLAHDQHVSNRWVVLKGLLDAGDEDAMAAAVAERRFLATVEHPNIVKIYNFLQHDGAGYTVMEYVGGTSLKGILSERRAAHGGHPDPLPVTQAIAYILEILPAIGYLHRLGLVFCDFKPDNVILQGDSLKLIDLGGVRRLDDQSGAVYGTVGFQAPEIAELGPSVASDLFTVARTLAVLVLDFKGYQSAYATTLPPPAEQPLLATFESLHRWLLKATAPNRDDRFQTADEMNDQLLGVLREIVAAEQGAAKPATSTWFTGDTYSDGSNAPDWRLLPTLKVDANDAAATVLANLPAVPPGQLVELLRNVPVMRTVEVELRLARAQIESGDAGDAGLNTHTQAANKTLDAIAEGDPWEWRVEWYRGIIAMAGNAAADAQQCFDRVYAEVPGELAPKLALAMAAERAGDLPTATYYYDVVSRTDSAFTTASYGLARCRAAAGDRGGTVDAYGRVPMTSIAYVDSQVRAARMLVNLDSGAAPGTAELSQASATLTRLALDAEQRARAASELLSAALELLRRKAVRPDPGVHVLGAPLQEEALRTGLERAYRDLARLAPTVADRIRLVDEANRVRPTTLV
jgi:serine/threonine-protein kinase PknG